MDNGEDWRKPNTFGEAALRSLEAAARRARGRATGAGSSSPGSRSCSRSARTSTSSARSRPSARARAAEAGHELFGRIRDLPFPTLAAINGAALGGGVEIALHCDYRTISSDVRHFACPEVLLGLIPGWGGTQLDPAARRRRAGREVHRREPAAPEPDAERASRRSRPGFADALLEPVEFLDESLALPARQDRGRAPASGARPPISPTSAEVVRKARSRLDGQVHGAAPAPYRALDLIEGAATWSLEEGYRAEEDALAELLPGPAGAGLGLRVRPVERRAKRGVGIPDAKPRRVQRVGIVGAGLMARQLALLALRRLEVPGRAARPHARSRSTTRRLDRDRARRARPQGPARRGQGALPRLARRRRHRVGRLRRLRPRARGGLRGDERQEGGLRRARDRSSRPSAILATNTSSLSVTEMGADLEHPERVVGMHFFNPVAVLPLVELVRTPQTDDVTLATAWDVSKKLRKTRRARARRARRSSSTACSAGRARSLTEALDHGNTVDETDEAVLRLGLPMAPSVLLQLVGPEGREPRAPHAARRVARPLPALRDAREPRRGRRAGRRRARAAHASTRSTRRCSRRSRTRSRHILEEGVVAEAADIDTCLILGAGFPFWLGGITKHLDQTGVSERVVGRPLAELVGTPA